MFGNEMSQRASVMQVGQVVKADSRMRPRQAASAVDSRSGAPRLRRHLLLTSALVSSALISSLAFTSPARAQSATGGDGQAGVIAGTISVGGGGGGGGAGAVLIGYPGPGNLWFGGAGGIGGDVQPGGVAGSTGGSGQANGISSNSGGAGGSVGSDTSTGGAGGEGAGGASGGAGQPAQTAAWAAGGSGGGGGAGVIITAVEDYEFGGDFIIGGAGGVGGSINATGPFTGYTVITGNGGAGGSGLVIAAAAIVSNVSEFDIMGGAGGDAGADGLALGAISILQGKGGDGGAAVVLSADGIDFSNAGIAKGGAGGSVSSSDVNQMSGSAGAGGAGVLISGNNSIVSNSGTLQGGDGGNWYSTGQGKSGIGLVVSGDSNTITNQKFAGIYGADIISGKIGVDYGGNAVLFSGTGNTITNYGFIEAGLDDPQGRGGAGIFVSGSSNKIINDGNIISTNGVGVYFDTTSTGSTLELWSNWGLVGGAINVGTNTTLALGGTVNQSFDLTLINSTFVDFNAYEKVGTSTWEFTGTTGSSGPASNWTVKEGILALGTGTWLKGDVTVASGGTLNATTASYGTAKIEGLLLIQSGGILNAQQGGAGSSGATPINSDTFTLNTGATVNIGLISVGADAAITSGGALTIQSGVTINLTGTTLVEGTYNLIEYSGAGGTFVLPTVGTVSGGLEGAISTTTSSLGNMLIATLSAGGLYWNGTTTSGGGPLVGGDGSWTASSGMLNWSNADGTTHVASNSTKTAIFSGTAGTVTIDASSGAVGAKSLKFLTSGYEITGDTLTLANASAAPTVNVDGAGTLATISSALAGTDGLEKIGDGTLILSGANAYTGGTTITGGTLQIGAGGAIGSIDGAIVNNAALVFNRSDAVTFSGVISGSGTLEKKGSATLTLSATNTYTGATTVSAGTLEVTNVAGLGTAAAGTTVAAGATLVMNVGSSTTVAESLTLSGTGTTGSNGALQGAAGAILSGTVTLAADSLIDGGNALELSGTIGGAGHTLTLSAGGTISGVIATGAGGVTKAGIGNWILSGANTYTGLTTVSAGALIAANASALGATSSGTTVASGASLVIDGNAGAVAIGAEVLSLSGTGSNPFAALTSLGGANSYGGAITLASDSSISVLNNTFAISGAIGGTGANLTLQGNGTGTITGVIGTGSGGVTKGAAGTWILSAANTYTGATTVSAGTLRVTANAGLGTTASGTTVASGATLDLRNTVSNVVIGTEALTLSGTGVSGAGALQSTGGLNSVAGAITLDADSLIAVTADQLTLSGGISGAGKNLTVGGAANGVVSGSIATGAGTLTKTGAGAWDLTAANSYTGLTTISAGMVRIANASALGTTDSGTVVASGATLALGGGITVGSEDLTLSGTGIVDGGSASQGALVSYGGNNTYAGAIVLAADSTINTNTYAASGSLDLSGGISGSGKNLTLGGLGAGTVSGVIGTDAGTVTKVDAGSWILSGANTYTGETIVSVGVLGVSNATGLGTLAGGTTVADGASLMLFGGVSVGAEALTLSGLGVNGIGALSSVQGTNSFAGAINLAADSLIVSSAGSDIFTLSGGITGAGKDLSLGGTGLGIVSGAIATGSGSLTKTGSGGWLLEGVNTYTGGTAVTGGTLAIGGANGSIMGDVVLSNGGTLTFSRTTDMTFAGVVSGTGSLTKTGNAKLTLSGTSTFVGTTTVYGGTLELSGGSLAGGVSVSSGATLQGGASAGTVSGNVSIAAGGTLAGVSGTTSLAIGGNLTFADATSIFAVTLEAPSTTPPAISAGGDLTLNGVLNLTAGTGFTSGTYRLIDYAGTLSGAGLEIGTAPAHSLYAVSTSTANQVNLLVAAGQWWNGSNTTGGAGVDGGTGTWNVQSATTNWTNAAGTTADTWSQAGLAIFAGTAGTVTVSGSTAPQVAAMEFLVDDYVITGGSINLVGFGSSTEATILVGEGPDAAEVGATVASSLTGTAGLKKTGLGTLTLSGTNSYAGLATVSAGTLTLTGSNTLSAGVYMTGGTLTIEGSGTLANTSGYIANGAGTTGTVVVTGADASWIGTGELGVGQGGQASFTVSAGAEASFAYSYVGVLAGSNGTATVTGKESIWTSTGAINVGYSGTGTVNVEAGGTLMGATGIVGASAGSIGTVTVTGAGSTWTATTELGIGQSGTGTLNVAAGGKVSTGIGYIGVNADSLGTATVTGEDSAWETTAELHVGYTGTGTLTVEDSGHVSTVNAYVSSNRGSTGAFALKSGATASSSFAYIGVNTGSNGSVTVTGADSLWTNSKDFVVGGSGSGQMTVSVGGGVSSGNGYIGQNALSTGTATVTGADSSWSTGSLDLFVGLNGTGTLSVADGGAVSAAHVTLGYGATGGGTLNLDGTDGARGVLTTGQISKGAGQGSVNFNGGVVKASASQASFLTGFADNTVTINAGGVFFDSNGFDIGVSAGMIGTGSLRKLGFGVLTLTGDNTYSGGTTVAAGTLQIGNGGGTGSVAGAIANSGTVAFNRSDDVVAGGAITGTGALVQKGAGKLTLTGANSAGAGTTVEAGTLEILSGVSLASNVTVKSGATLQGETAGPSGAAITGSVSVENGGTLAAAPVTTAGAYGLSMTSLTLSESANINVTLGSNTGNAVFSAETLALDGVLNVTDGGSMALGVYRILDYTTLASDDGLVLGDTPLQYAYEIQQVPGQVNLAVLQGGMLYWNGSQTTPDGTIHGGAGTWTASSTDTNWTTSKANQSRAWDASFAVFSATAGVVTIDDTAGAVAVTGVQFMVDGYEVGGDALTLAATSGQTQIRVGDGTGAGAAYVATIGSVIAGSTGLEKTDLGTLILTGASTYTGGTTITQGTLQIGKGGTTGSIEGDVVNNAALVFNRSNDLGFDGAISGTGSVTKKGAGTLTLTGTNAFSGGLTVKAGTVKVAAASALGSGGLSLEGDGALQASESFSYGGAVTLTPVAGLGGGTFAVDDSKTLTLTGAIGGTGALTKSGTGTLAIAGNSYSGATNVAAGTLEVSGGSSLSNTARLTVASGATLTLKDANETVGSLAGGGDVALGAYCLIAGGDGTSSTFSGAFSGAGCLTKTGEGTLTLTGTSNHSGGTTISGGTVQVSAAAALGSGPLALEGGGTLRASDSFTYASAVSLTPVAGVGGGTFAVDDSKTLTLTGAIAGLGNLAKTGTGTLVLSGTNSASGATKVDEGILIAEGGQAIGDASAVSVATGAQLILRPSGATETVGSIAGAGALVLDGAKLAAGGDNTSTSFAGIISGTGGLTKSGTGTLTLSGANTYAGDTTVAGGGLAVTGSVDGDVYVQNLATLSGTGSIAKTVHVLDGGTLEGAQPGGLTMGGLDLAAAANVSVSLGAPSSEAVFTVNGNVTLDGTLKVTQTAGFGVGIYRVMNYTGTLTDNGMEVSPLTGGLLGGVQTSVANQVNLLVEGVDTPILFWNGTNTTATQTVLGGTGTWTAGAQTNWINASGTIPQGWNGAFAVFQGSPGTVTVDNTDGQVSATGLQFVETGYGVSGGALLLAGEAPVIRVGDGTEEGASTVATIGSVLTGTHGLEKADYGTLVLTGANLYTGGTVISGGTLQIGDGGASGSILGDVTNNSVLAFNRSDDVTMAGAISGSGALVQAGEGTLYLTGANTSTGGTTIASGTLRVDAASALGSGGLTVDTEGTLRASSSFTYGGAVVLGVPNPLARPSSTAGTIEVDSTQALTLSGVISGTAGLTKTGDGLLILTGTNTYAGVTTISAGTLQIGNGGTTGSIVGDVVNNAKLVFNRSDTYAFTGAITGNGAVTFTGGGTVLFSAPYTGAVTVDDSTVRLAAGSSTASTFTVNEGGVLGGTASIGGLIVNDGGIVGPGYSPGTLTVNGPVAFNAGAVYQVDVTAAGGHDLITATGAVTLSSQASVEVLATPGRYPSTGKVAILSTTNTLTGTFGSVTSDYAFLAPELTYDAKNVFLTLVYNGFNFVDYAHTPNQANVAVAAQALGTGNAVYEAIFALPTSAVAPALNQLSGEAYASAQTVIQQQSIYLRDAVGSRLRQSLTAPSAGALSYAAKAAGPATAQLAQGFTPTLWAEGFGGWGEVSGNGNAASVNTTVGGVFGGIDVAVLDTLRVGLVGGYSRTSFDIDGRSSQGTMDNYDIGLYAGAQFDALALRGGASYTWHDISVSRSVVFPGYYGTQDGDYTLGTTQLFGEIGYDLSVGAYAFEPFVGLAYVHISGDSFTESGTLASALSVDGASQGTFYSTLGVRAATSFTVAGRTLTTSATLGWQHAFGDTTSTADMLFANGGTNPFTIRGVPIAEDVALVGLGLGYQLSDSAALQLNYAGQLADQTNQNTFSAQFSLKF